MNNLEKLMSIGETSWSTVIIVAFLLFFLAVELSKGFDTLKGRFGFWESKTSRRIRKLEDQLSSMEDNMNGFCKQIQGVRDEFNKKETEHWNESKEIRQGYDERILSLGSKLDTIIEHLEKKDSLDFKKLRNQLVQMGEDAIDRGYISIRKLKSLEELYEEYTDKYDGNSYVKTLMEKIRRLKVVGKLNEHGEDIED